MMFASKIPVSVVGGLSIALVLTAPARAYEAGYAGADPKPGITLGGGSAETPSPGIYMFDQLLTYHFSRFPQKILDWLSARVA
jgi:hypothetical protein